MRNRLCKILIWTAIILLIAYFIFPLFPSTYIDGYEEYRKKLFIVPLILLTIGKFLKKDKQ